ncbi:MAG: phosphatase PAP2 family protein [Anaerolineae bacterium]|nr:phosphatase PAP2 family protein [Anaerolineae bacterium]
MEWISGSFRKGWVWVVAIILALSIGFSRIYLGVHFPTDVFLGWALGIIVLILSIQLEKPVIHWIRKFGVWQKISLVFALSIVFILINALVIQTVNSSFTLPASWVQNASLAAPEEPIAPLSLSAMVTIMASAFGFISGVIWLGKKGGFSTRGTWLVRAGRFVVGIIGVMALRYGLDVLFSLVADDLSTLGYILRYIRYGTIGLWMSALAPLLFFRLRLADPAK